MQYNISFYMKKQLYLSLIIFIYSVLFSSSTMLANSNRLYKAKNYNYLKADLAIDSGNQLASTSGQDDDINSAIKSSLLSYGSDKLTPSPNEDIDLYSGTLKLHYTDFSIPIAPGLNLEVNRIYDSTVYNYVNYAQNTNFWAYDYNMPSWNIGTSYLFERATANCSLDNDPCDLIVINSNGSAESLRRKDTGTQKWESKNGSIYDGNTGILIDKKGFKYYFTNHSFVVNGGWRDYLTKVETPDGNHWLKYEYHGPYLKEIISSDSSKKISINISKPPEFYKQHYGNFSMLEPTGIIFNGKQVVTYDYGFYDGLKKFFGRIALNKVTKANGETVYYNYDYINLKRKHGGDYPSNWRLQLIGVKYSNGESASYTYVDDDDLYAHQYLRNIRINTVTHYTNKKFNEHENSNTWSISQNSGTTYNGIKSRTVTVTSPYHSTKTTYSHNSDQFAWQAGLPLEKTIYKNKTISDSNILQKEIFHWDKILFSNQFYYLSSSIKEAGFDTQTFKPRMVGKNLLQYNSNGIDTYTVNINGFDDYDNPTELIITGNNGQKRSVSNSYDNYPDKNILGLNTQTNIDGNNILQQDFDEYGNVISSKKLGKKFSFNYINGLLSAKTDANGNTTHYQNYNGVEPTTIVGPDTTTLHKVTNTDGTTHSETDANGNTISYEYDDNQRLIKTIPSIEAPTNYAYKDFDRYITFDNYSAEEKYNHAGLLLSKTENNDRKQILQYDGLGRKIFESYPFKVSLSNSTKGHYYNYDSLNRLTSDCYPEQSQSCVSYNYLMNNTVKITAPTGEYKVITYDPFSPGSNKPIKIIEDGRTTEINRDYLNRVISVNQHDSKNSVTKNYTYDNNHNLIKYIEPETGVTEYFYDKAANLEKVLLNGKSIEYDLDPRNYRIRAKKYSDDSYNESFQYDNNGNLLKSTKGNITKIYKYNESGKLIKEGFSLGVKHNNIQKNIYINYDYNNKGYLSAVTYPDDYILDLNPDVYGNPTRLGNYIGNILYHANNKWSSYHLANGLNATAQQDDYQRINKYNYGSLSLDYDYDSNNNLRSLTLSDLSSKDYNFNLSFNYDLLGRITGAKGPWGNKAYTYDGLNNITNITQKNQASNNSYNFQYANLKLTAIKSAADTQTFDYDNLGNISRDNNNQYIYGLDSNLLNTYGVNSYHYQYDTNGHRLIKTERGLYGESEIITLYNKSGDLLMEYDLNRDESIKYIYLNGHKAVQIEQPLDKNTKDKSKVEYFYNDAIGSPAAMADNKGNILWRQVYEPFGLTYLKQDSDGNNKFGFAGKELDGTNLNYFGARYYSASQARFMSPDPVDVQPDNPNTFNRYVYANNNPYKYIDPDGRFSFSEMPSLPEPFVNAVAGFGDGISSALTFGFYSTRDVRNSLDIGSVDYDSSSYSISNYTGMAWGTGTYWTAGLNGGSNTVFWSGPGAKSAAEGFALKNSGRTLEMTPIGSMLDKMTTAENFKYMKPLWTMSSRTFANNAKGTANVFQSSKGVRLESVWAKSEFPILKQRRININYRTVN